MKIAVFALASVLALSGSVAMAQSSAGSTAAGGSSAAGGEGTAGAKSGPSASTTTVQKPATNDASKSGAPNASSAEKGTTTGGSMSK